MDTASGVEDKLDFLTRSELILLCKGLSIELPYTKPNRAELREIIKEYLRGGKHRLRHN